MCLLSMDGDAGASPFVAESALDADSFESILDMNESRGKRILRSFMQVVCQAIEHLLYLYSIKISDWRYPRCDWRRKTMHGSKELDACVTRRPFFRTAPAHIAEGSAVGLCIQY